MGSTEQREKRERQKQQRLAQLAQRQQEQGEEGGRPGPGNAGGPGSSPTPGTLLQQVSFSRQSTSASSTAAPVAEACEQPVKEDADGAEAELSLLLSSLGIGAPSAPLQPDTGAWQQGEMLRQPCSREQPEPQPQEPRAPPMPPAACLASTPGGTASSEPAPAPTAVAAVVEASASQPEGPEDDSCVVCMEGPKESVFFPCGHQALCQRCTLELFGSENTADRECPICKGQSDPVPSASISMLALAPLMGYHIY